MFTKVPYWICLLVIASLHHGLLGLGEHQGCLLTHSYFPTKPVLTAFYLFIQKLHIVLEYQFQFVALPFGLATAPQVFFFFFNQDTGLSLRWGDLLFWISGWPALAIDSLSVNVQTMMQTPQSFGWILKFKTSAVDLMHHLEYLVIDLDIALRCNICL